MLPGTAEAYSWGGTVWFTSQIWAISTALTADCRASTQGKFAALDSMGALQAPSTQVVTDEQVFVATTCRQPSASAWQVATTVPELHDAVPSVSQSFVQAGAVSVSASALAPVSSQTARRRHCRCPAGDRRHRRLQTTRTRRATNKRPSIPMKLHSYDSRLRPPRRPAAQTELHFNTTLTTVYLHQ